MTMYLPNADLQPAGGETTEFIDVPSAVESAIEVGSRRLDTQTRLNIARWAEEYISGLVENHNGGPEDVRAVIHELYDERALGPEP
jgi:hypothetical protein